MTICHLNAGKSRASIPVHFFGTNEYQRCPGRDVMSFEEGLQRNAHLKCRRRVSDFQAALRQVTTYMQVGCVRAGVVRSRCVHLVVVEALSRTQ